MVLHQSGDFGGQPQRCVQRFGPWAMLSWLPRGLSDRHRRIAILLQRFRGKPVVVGSKVGGRGHESPQAVHVGQCGLQPQAGVLANTVRGIRGVQPPIGPGLTLRALAQSMTDFVKDHLGQRIVRVQRVGSSNPQGRHAIPKGKHIVAALNTDSHLFRRTDPDDFEGILIRVLNTPHTRSHLNKDLRQRFTRITVRFPGFISLILLVIFVSSLPPSIFCSQGLYLFAVGDSFAG